MCNPYINLQNQKKIKKPENAHLREKKVSDDDDGEQRCWRRGQKEATTTTINEIQPMHKTKKKTSFVTNIFGVVIFVLFADFLAKMLLHSLQYACLLCVYAFSVLLVFALFYGLSSLEK